MAPRAEPRRRAAGWSEQAAPAKLNLYLHVVGRRADGYHLLDSLVAFASFGDHVEVSRAPELIFTVDGEFAAAVPAGVSADDNLMVKAARMLAEALDRPPEVAIHLAKSLPAAAGVGGGSADAAATLRALADLWGVDRKDSRIQALACRLGADVPVCLAGRTSRLGGIGDRLDPAPSLAGVPIVLANPKVPVSTPQVFKSFAGAFSAPSPPGDPPREPAALAGWIAERRNDLAAPAERLAPAIGEVIATLGGAPGCLLARMSGSGATCFGIFETVELAGRGAAQIRAAQPGWWIKSGTLI